jgi:RsiW-degrading membrane proteinase PrsW (M82 family)
VPAPGSAVPPGAAGARVPSPGLSGEELSTALGILFPVRAWLHDPGWRQGFRLLVIVYALLPLIFLAVLANSSSLSTPGWAYSLYIAPLWAIGFWLLIRPGKITKLEIQVGAGVIIWTFVWITVVTVHINGLLGHPPLSLPAALVVGFNEETTKALPVLIAGLVVLRYRHHRLGVRMCMFMGTIAGLTFGVTEQAFYTSSFIVLIHQAHSVGQADLGVLAFAERVFVDGFQHAVWAGIAGFFIGMALNYRRRRVPLIVLGIAVPAVLHALNDWLAPSIFLAVVVQAASLLLFIGYTMRAESIERQVRTSPIFRGESMLLEAADLSFEQPGGGAATR